MQFFTLYSFVSFRFTLRRWCIDKWTNCSSVNKFYVYLATLIAHYSERTRQRIREKKKLRDIAHPYILTRTQTPYFMAYLFCYCNKFGLMGFSFLFSVSPSVCVVPVSFVLISFGLSHQSMCPRQPYINSGATIRQQ